MEGQAVMIQITTVSVCLVAFMCLLFWARYYYQKKATTNLLCIVRTKENNSYREMLPVLGGMVTIDPIKNKKGKTIRSGKTFVVKDLPRLPIDYPENFPKILQTRAQMAILDEVDIMPWDRQTNGRSVIDPELFYNLDNEKYTEIMVAHSEEVAELEEQIRALTKSSLGKTQWWLVAITGGIIAIGVFLYLNLTNIIEGINIIRAGLGV